MTLIEAILQNTEIEVKVTSKILNQQEQYMIVEGHTFKRVRHFMYLGHLLTQDGN